MNYFTLFVLFSSGIIHIIVGQTESEAVANNAVNAANEIGNEEPPEFTSATFGVLTDELRSWDPPEYLKKNFPYYMSGLDFEGRPIWVAEMGKYNLRAVLQRGGLEVEAEMSKLMAQAGGAIVDTYKLKDPENHDAVFIIDMDGLKYEQFADVRSITFLLREGRRYKTLLEQGTAYVAVINTNYVTQGILSLLRPVVGKTWEVVDIFGTDKTKWLPRLLRHFPRESLPEWYGGYKNFTPYRVMP